MRILMLMPLLFLIGCASVGNKKFASFKDDTGTLRNFEDFTITGLRVTYERDERLSDNNFVVVQMTFENQSQDWLRINNVVVDLDNEELNKTVYIPKDRDLRVWAEAVKQKISIEEYNSNLLLSSLAVGGGGSSGII